MKVRKRKQLLALRYLAPGYNVIIDCTKYGDFIASSRWENGMPMYYTLDANHVPIPCFNTLEWARWYQGADRHVALDDCPEYRVSTVFLSLDHNYSFGGDPVLFETMVFFPDGDYGDMARYCTWADAKAGHERIKSMLDYELAQAHALSVNALKSVMEPRP